MLTWVLCWHTCHVPALVEPQVPFRWDLITPDHLGTLLDGVDRPDLWFADDLLECAGKVLARAGDGDLFFVGRSLDSMFDLLGGALAGTSWSSRLHRLPLSFAIPDRLAHGRWHPDRISHTQHEQAKRILGALGLSPSGSSQLCRGLVYPHWTGAEVCGSRSTMCSAVSVILRSAGITVAVP